MQSQTLYDYIKELREVENHPYHRILLSGYFNDDFVKRENLNTEQFVSISSYQASR